MNAETRAQLERELANRCDGCGNRDTSRWDCRPWCPVMAGTCTCGSSSCGECMRYGGTSLSGFGVQR